MNAQPIKIKILYRDSFYLAVHKPAGIATYRESRDSNADGCKEIVEEQLTQRLFPVHRIDADTSGVVIFALDSRAAAAMIRIFKEHRVNKTYHAWCFGELPAKGAIRTALKKHKTEIKESAITEYERIKFVRGNTLVKAFPFTGRFHQIRRHFASIQHPVLGDPLYSKPESWGNFFKGEPRLMLQAESIEFQHPFTKRTILIRTKEAL